MMQKVRIGFVPSTWESWDGSAYTGRLAGKMRARCLDVFATIPGLEIVVPSESLTEDGCVGTVAEGMKTAELFLQENVQGLIIGNMNFGFETAVGALLSQMPKDMPVLHLQDEITKPEIIGVCDMNPASFAWFDRALPGLKYHFTDYQDLLACEDIEAVYCAVPHVLHQQVYCDIINAGKHLMGEKPFGMDKAQNDAILSALKNHPEVFCRCASEFPFFPACQRVIAWAREGKLGKIIEVKAAFNHASDLDPQKPINWKRKNAVNGVYGCMGDLGLHTQHVPFALGWVPETVYAVLSNIITERPDGKGGVAPCDTWDNATMLCRVKKDGYEFPMTLETKRIEPGATDQWYIKINGTKASVYFTSEAPDAFHYLYADGPVQAWSRVLVGSRTLFPTITGENFEFGFSDSILQMWAAYMSELEGKEQPFGCVKPEHTHLSHALITAALQSYEEQRAVTINYGKRDEA